MEKASFLGLMDDPTQVGNGWKTEDAYTKKVSLSSFEFQVFYDFYGLLWFSMCFFVFQEGSNLSSQVSGTVADSMELG